jgi:hypothetical protein
MKWHEKQERERMGLRKLAATAPKFEDFLVAMGVTDVARRKTKLRPVPEEDIKKEDMQFLAERITQHKAPPIILLAALQPVDRKLLAKTAARLQKQKSVLATIKCSEVKN